MACSNEVIEEEFGEGLGLFTKLKVRVKRS